MKAATTLTGSIGPAFIATTTAIRMAALFTGVVVPALTHASNTARSAFVRS